MGKVGSEQITDFIETFGRIVRWILDLINLRNTGAILGYMGGWTLEAPLEAYVLIELPE
jgi:hypothetical protein